MLQPRYATSSDLPKPNSQDNQPEPVDNPAPKKTSDSVQFVKTKVATHPILPQFSQPALPSKTTPAPRNVVDWSQCLKKKETEPTSQSAVKQSGVQQPITQPILQPSGPRSTSRPATKPAAKPAAKPGETELRLTPKRKVQPVHPIVAKSASTKPLSMTPVNVNATVSPSSSTTLPLRAIHLGLPMEESAESVEAELMRSARNTTTTTSVATSAPRTQVREDGMMVLYVYER